ncbi:MAG TPA: alpha-amylase family glycosyl hydrolase, partial [Chloroflexota bacterium]|nr:alpha-amylase family glycosyl hydrolase [Chloroflexota bacterium]
MNQELFAHLQLIYGTETAATVAERLDRMLAAFQASAGPERPASRPRVSHQDAILITYGNMVQTERERPLTTLAHFLENHLTGLVSAVHLLPFFPYSSDDGFSVIDYKAVHPAWGDWPDVAQIGGRQSGRFRLMFDLVVNHTSVQCEWFQAFLREERPYTDFYITADPDADLSMVFRPRTHPLLTPFATETGTRHVWTTFSADQVDLNFANPEVLLAILDVLLFYVAQGAEFIRLDAIAYIWKESGTDCLHRPQAHEIVKLMRTVLNQAAPHVSLITETNVPHAENIAYFGNGRDEAQLVYNFSLPPLTLHAFHTGNAEILSQWADSLTLPSDETTFFNFLASHDGIGVQPARGLLSDTAVTDMANRIKALGGYVNYKTNSDGSQSPYELNCTYLDALGDPDQPDEPIALKAQRFL